MACCTDKNCVNEGNKKKGGLCHTCYARKFRLLHPLKASYAILKSNAKRRGIYFNLSIKHWEWFCNTYDYLNKRGLDADSMSVDRIDSNFGYIDGNIQPLTLSENSHKANKERRTKSWGVAEYDPDCGF